ncbi:MAG: hypothetical protein CMK07_01610 [Ponticaulis sp.]|nr:hypothetical protein [Ponticaulis sp.]
MKIVETGPLIDDLGISDASLAAIILKAKRFDAIVAESDPEEASNASDDREIDSLEDQPDNPARYELETAIAGLEPNQQETLVALTWLGRGNYSADEWTEAKAMARDRDNGDVPNYLSGVPTLGDYLEAGAASLGINVTGEEAAMMSHPQNPNPVEA